MECLSEYKLGRRDIAVICSVMASYVRESEAHIEKLTQFLNDAKAAATRENDLPVLLVDFPDDDDADSDEEAAEEIARWQAAVDEAKKELEEARAIRLKTDMIRAFYEKFLEEGVLK